MVRDLVDDRLIRSVQLWAAVAATGEYSAAAGVMAFVGCKGEPDTDPLFARLAADGKRLLLPRVHEGDIVVCDGFVGNIVLKFYESVAKLIVKLVKRESPAVLQQPEIRGVFRHLDYSEYGGAPLLGVKGVSIICHGSSSPNAFKNAIRVATQALSLIHI